jgi:predicted nucleotidyltransferase
MFTIEKDVLGRISARLKAGFPERIVAVYAFGSKVRGNHSAWSDFDVLIIVRRRDPLIEHEIIDIFVDEELQSGLIFTPVIKDAKAFEQEKDFHTPFYENILKGGILF